MCVSRMSSGQSGFRLTNPVSRSICTVGCHQVNLVDVIRSVWVSSTAHTQSGLVECHQVSLGLD